MLNNCTLATVSSFTSKSFNSFNCPKLFLFCNFCSKHVNIHFFIKQVQHLYKRFLQTSTLYLHSHFPHTDFFLNQFIFPDIPRYLNAKNQLTITLNATYQIFRLKLNIDEITESSYETKLLSYLTDSPSFHQLQFKSYQKKMVYTLLKLLPSYHK